MRSLRTIAAELRQLAEALRGSAVTYRDLAEASAIPGGADPELQRECGEIATKTAVRDDGLADLLDSWAADITARCDAADALCRASTVRPPEN